jgi:hypothetical protein
MEKSVNQSPTKAKRAKPNTNTRKKFKEDDKIN